MKKFYVLYARPIEGDDDEPPVIAADDDIDEIRIDQQEAGHGVIYEYDDDGKQITNGKMIS